MYKVNGGRTIQDLVNRDDWQKIRKSLLGKWKVDPNSCLRIIKQWVGSLSNAENDKLYIVLNYLTGTGFRSRTINFRPADAYREEVKEEIKRRKHKSNPEGVVI